MAASNDIDLLVTCARSLPFVSFVFAGQITAGDYTELLSLPNVHHLGKLPYEKIPSLCAGCDVCLLAWKMRDWIRSCNPLKMFEYMASGKPIVSVPITEAIQYSEIISIAHNKEQFAEAIRWELQNDTPERSRRRIQVASDNNYERYIDKLSSIILNTIAEIDDREN